MRCTYNPRTRGIGDRVLRLGHWSDHEDLLGHPGVAKYEFMAIFSVRPKPAAIHECTRKGGDIVRYNPNTGEFGVLSQGGIIRTYFKLVPSVLLPNGTPRQKKACHKKASNWDYFLEACSQ